MSETFNIEEYLYSLYDFEEIIDISNKNLTYLPDLSRFKNLKILSCYHNNLVSLPPLPNSLQILYCSHNQLVSLPPLPNSLQELYCYNNQLSSLYPLPNSLEILFCDDNQLVSLPSLPNSLEILRCYNNQLVTLPPLPNSLKLLYCNNNQLTSLPPLPNSLEILFCKNNPTDEFINPYTYSIIDTKKHVKILNKFINLYYCIKYKNKFRKWLWDIREKKVKEEYHPDRLREILEGKDINDIDF